ncbi:MAG: DUF6603 domain-containing protein [Bacteroidia bacterium]
MDEPTFQWEKLFHTLERSLLANGFLMRYVLPRKSVVDPGNENDHKPFATYVNPDYMLRYDLHELQLPLMYGSSTLDELFYNISLAMMPIGKPDTSGNQVDASKEPAGLLLTPIIQGGTNHQFFITPEISLNLGAGLDLTNAAAVALFPDSTDLIWNIEDAEIDFSVALKGSPYSPWVILGGQDSHRLELRGFELKLAVLGEVDDPEIKLLFKATSPSPESRGIQVIIQTEEADAFVSESAPENKIEAGFDLEIEWSSKHGFRFGGNVEFDLQLYLNQKLGPITVSNVYMSLKEGPGVADTSPNSIRLRTGVGFQGKLGPVEFVVENIGFNFDVIPYSQEDLNREGIEPPLLGMLDLDMGFAPPKGVGFRVNTSSVTGGGYLYLDPEKGRYLGEAELSVLDEITLKAIGIIDTQLPDGKEGYSFLLVISAEFDPIQLGFGFKLEGVGGIVGIHRSLDLKAIQSRVRDDSFDKVLFPEDPLSNLTSIVSSLDAILPVAQDRYTFGLMAKLSWGSPKLVDIKMGLIMQAPAFQLALIGVAKSEIKRVKEPEEEGEEASTNTVLRLQIGFAATYEPKKALFAFDASLYDSEILGQKLQGDAAIRLRGGDDPYFMLSVGGFHPSFDPPKGLGLPDLKRIELAFQPESLDIDISAQFYCAITANTVQFGARAEASYSALSFRIEGGVGFNALFQFSPVYFIVDAFGYVTLYAFGSEWGLKIEGQIEGPYPFAFALKVTVDLGLFSKTFSIPRFTIGSSARSQLPTADVLREIRLALEDDRNWEAVIPERLNLLVSLRNRQDSLEAVEDRDQDLIFHPVGGLKIEQERVPLNLILDKFGHNQPEEHNFFDVELKGKGVEKTFRHFAPAQFLDLTEEEKLDRPSFEKMEAGIVLSEIDKIDAGQMIHKEINYERILLTNSGEGKKKQQKEPLTPNEWNRWAANSTIARSALGKRQKRKVSRKASFSLQDEAYAIVSFGHAANFNPIRLPSETAARQKMNEIIALQPALAGQLAIIPAHETSLPLQPA